MEGMARCAEKQGAVLPRGAAHPDVLARVLRKLNLGRVEIDRHRLVNVPAVHPHLHVEAADPVIISHHLLVREAFGVDFGAVFSPRRELVLLVYLVLDRRAGVLGVPTVVRDSHGSAVLKLDGVGGLGGSAVGAIDDAAAEAAASVAAGAATSAAAGAAATAKCKVVAHWHREQRQQDELFFGCAWNSVEGSASFDTVGQVVHPSQRTSTRPPEPPRREEDGP